MANSLQRLQPPSTSTMLIDQFMPVYHFSEHHAADVRATSDRVWIALKQVTPAEMPWLPVLRILAGLRGLPARLAGRPGLQLLESKPLLELSANFAVLAEQPEREIVLGTLNQFWSLRGGRAVAITSPQQFLAFDQPGYAKAVLNFALKTGSAPHTTRVSTETRVYAVDKEAYRRFAVYWRVIHMGSALIRRLWLAGIKRRAEHGPRGTA